MNHGITFGRISTIGSTLMNAFSNRSMGIVKHCAPLLVFTITLSIFAGESRATVLIFDQARDAVSGTIVEPTSPGANVPQDYGDRVTGSPMDVLGGQFTYGNEGEGFTPNIVVDYFSGGNVALWTVQYGDLNNVMFSTANSNHMNVQLTADTGFDVLLYGFDLAGWPNADYTIDAVSVFSGGTTLFSQNNVVIEGDFTGPQHTSFDFASPLSGSQLLIEIDFNNITGGIQDNIGIDNIRFGQNPPPVIPEPISAVLFVVGGATVGLRMFLKRKPY